MGRLIFNRTIIRRTFTTEIYHYFMILFRNEIKALETGINHDEIRFYRVKKTNIKRPKLYYPRIEDKIDPQTFRKIEEAYDICIRR